jgi:quinol monooxygenase YgiN
MYGTIFRMRPKPGQEQAIIDLVNDWESKRRGKVEGAVGALLMRPDSGSGELVGIAVFEDKATYDANADDPEQDRWYQSLRALRDSDPQWEDGEYVAGELG